MEAAVPAAAVYSFIGVSPPPQLWELFLLLEIFWIGRYVFVLLYPHVTHFEVSQERDVYVKFSRPES